VTQEVCRQDQVSIDLPCAQTLVQVRPDLFDGIVTVVADAEATPVADSDSLYRSEPFSTTSTRLVAVPYYTWNNRGPNPMQVWIAES